MACEAQVVEAGPGLRLGQRGRRGKGQGGGGDDGGDDAGQASGYGAAQ
jgi:hypothetical protein